MKQDTENLIDISMYRGAHELVKQKEIHPEYFARFIYQKIHEVPMDELRIGLLRLALSSPDESPASIIEQAKFFINGYEVSG
ncbi:hypothetical protein FMR74_24555 [Escherichia coli]|nr:hypothetical protein [Escherichia coli]